MIKVHKLTRKYGPVIAVEGVSFEIPKGQIVGLLGHNGAGKTTTIKMITGYLEPTDGLVEIDGQNILDHRLGIQRKIGYLSESSPLYPEMTVWDYLTYVAELRGIPESQKRPAVLEALKATDLEIKAKEQIETLSKGYRQRVGVAQAIIHKPEILILDEPTNGLDPTQILAMRTLIKNLAKNATVIISTHIMQEVEAICDRVLIVLNGKLVVDSSLTDLQHVKNITFSVDQPMTAVTTALQHLSGIQSIEAMDAVDGFPRFRAIMKQDDGQLAPEIAKTLIQKGWNLYHIQKEHRNLETVFRQVNRHREGAAHHVS